MLLGKFGDRTSLPAMLSRTVSSRSSRTQATIKLTKVRESSEADFYDRQFVLTPERPSIIIGRASRRHNDRGKPNPDNATFESPVISREHARLWIEDKRVLIEDLASLHGTSINGQRVDKRVTHDLKTGDIVTIGNDVSHSDKKFMSREFRISVEWSKPPRHDTDGPDTQTLPADPQPNLYPNMLTVSMSDNPLPLPVPLAPHLHWHGRTFSVPDASDDEDCYEWEPVPMAQEMPGSSRDCPLAIDDQEAPHVGPTHQPHDTRKPENVPEKTVSIDLQEGSSDLSDQEWNHPESWPFSDDEDDDDDDDDEDEDESEDSEAVFTPEPEQDGNENDSASSPVSPPEPLAHDKTDRDIAQPGEFQPDQTETRRYRNGHLSIADLIGHDAPPSKPHFTPALYNSFPQAHDYNAQAAAKMSTAFEPNPWYPLHGLSGRTVDPLTRTRAFPNGLPPVPIENSKPATTKGSEVEVQADTSVEAQTEVDTTRKRKFEDVACDIEDVEHVEKSDCAAIQDNEESVPDRTTEDEGSIKQSREARPLDMCSHSERPRKIRRRALRTIGTLTAGAVFGASAALGALIFLPESYFPAA